MSTESARRQLAAAARLGGVAVLLSLLFASSAGTATSTKFYSVSLAPNPVQAGSTFTVSITNCGAASAAPCSSSTVSNQTLGSTNVTFTGFAPPAGPIAAADISVTTASGAPSSKVWSATVVGSTVQLRATNALGPGEKVSVRITAPTIVGTYPTTSDARQSNDFSGQPGNKFTNADGDPALVVGPAALHHFVFDTIPSGAANPKAGVQYTGGATAYDRFNNVKTDYAGPGTLSGNLGGTPVGCGGPCTPSYSVGTWSAGRASVSFTPYKAESSRHLTLSDSAAGVSNNSNDFTVDPGDPYTLTFTQQPTQTQATAVINAATTPTGVRVFVQDQFGNLVPNAAVTVGIGNNPAAGTLGGTKTRNADSSTAVANFDNLTIDQTGAGYTLVATSGSATRTSKAFLIGDSVTACTGTCHATSSKNGSSLTVDASGTNSGETLGLGLVPGAPPSGVCAGFTPGIGVPEVFINIAASGATGNPVVTVTWFIDQSVVNLSPNNGAGNYNVCLGAVNVLDPQGTGSGFPTRGGGTATPVFDPLYGVVFFYGVLPSCQGSGTPVNPCLAASNKVNGSVTLTFVVPYPWIGSFDPTAWGG
jgi:hypothetical protein